MHSTIRFRLTLWYVSILATILILFSLGIYSLLRNNLLQRMDGGLRSALQVASLSLNHEIEEHGGKAEGEKNFIAVVNTMHQTSFPRPGIAIWEGKRLIAEKPGTAGVAAQEAGEFSSQIEDEVFSDIISADHIPYRVIASEVYIPEIQTRYHIVVNESMEAMEAELSTLREILLIAVPVFLILAAASGFFMARKSVEPMLAMARTAEEISSHNLDQRLQVANPGDELGILADTFNRLFARLQKSFEQQRQFMTDASHELRTPLSIALTATQVNLATKPKSQEEVTDVLEVIQSQLLRLRRVVEDMFTLAQAENEIYQPKITSFYLDEILAETVRAARVLSEAKKIQIYLNIQESDLIYTGDEGLLRQLFLILLDNAVKYSSPGKPITVSLVRSESGITVAVADEGCGIPEAAQTHIFDRFYRVDRSRSRSINGSGSGAGLGLAIAQWIAQIHQGQVYLSQSDSQGSMFTVELPLSFPQ